MQLDLALSGHAARKVAEPRSDGVVSTADDPPGGRWTEANLLAHLRARGARSIDRVVFRANRSTIWSITRSGTCLNLHIGFRGAPTGVVDAFAVIVRGWRSPTPVYRRAARQVRDWPGLDEALKSLREAPRTNGQAQNGRGLAGGSGVATAPCVGTPSQQQLLRRAFRHFNHTRLGGLLPDDLLLRFSARMTQRLGQMQGLGQLEGVGRTQGTGLAGSDLGSGARAEMEIALSIDLLLEGNEAEFVETLLHEMAHAADYAERGATDHGPQWKSWARRIGCSPRACTTVKVRRRSRGRKVLGVPPGLRAFAEPGGPTGDRGV